MVQASPGRTRSSGALYSPSYPQTLVLLVLPFWVVLFVVFFQPCFEVESMNIRARRVEATKAKG